MHRAVPMIAAVNDLSGFGRCSLTVALPVLSAMGFQVCPVPTALLSNHTGYESFYFEDCTEKLPRFSQEWEKLHLQFDAFYTGFLGNPNQVQKLLPMIRSLMLPDGILVVDPVIGDHGIPYSTQSMQLCQELKKLVALADATTPNLTEACLLLGEDYRALIATAQRPDFVERIYQMAFSLCALGARRTVITGVPVPGDPTQIQNIAVDMVENRRFAVISHNVSRAYAGAGDLFSSLLCGFLLRKCNFESAITQSALFVSKAAAFSLAQDLPPLDGVAFEPFLSSLGRKD